MLVNQKKDGKHEDVAYQYLKQYFKKNVIEPIKNHVKAKRFLSRDKKNSSDSTTCLFPLIGLESQFGSTPSL